MPNKLQKNLTPLQGLGIVAGLALVIALGNLVPGWWDDYQLRLSLQRDVKITLKQYQQLKRGMTLDQVKAFLGAEPSQPGLLVDGESYTTRLRHDRNAITLTPVVHPNAWRYFWRNPDKSSATLIFDEGRLVKWEQTGLR